MFKKINISNKFKQSEQIVVYPGDCLDLLKQIPDGSLQLVVTSPPYNIGKEYEKKLKLSQYRAASIGNPRMRQGAFKAW